MRSFAIHIYNNAEEHKAKVESICEENGVKIGPLFEAVIENMPEDEWTRYAEMANTKKGMSRQRRQKLSKQINSLDEKGMAAVLQALKAQGIDLDEVET